MGIKVISLIYVCLIIKWLILSSYTSFLSVTFLLVVLLLSAFPFSNWFMWLCITRLLFSPECTAMFFTCVFAFGYHFLGFFGGENRVWMQGLNFNGVHLSIPSIMVCAPRCFFINPRVTSIWGSHRFGFYIWNKPFLEFSFALMWGRDPNSFFYPWINCPFMCGLRLDSTLSSASHIYSCINFIGLNYCSKPFS